MNKKDSLSPTDYNQAFESVSNTQFLDLPNEILLEIFKHLSFCEMRKYAATCKRWDNLSWGVSLLENVSIKEKIIPIKVLEKILRSGVKKLKIKQCKLRILTDTDGVCFEGTRCNTLQALYIDKCCRRPFQTFLEYILKSCLNLQELIIFSGWIDEAVSRMILGMKSLQILHIAHNTYKSSNIAKYVSKCARFHGLSYLHVYTDLISDIELFNEALIISAPQLRFLIIKNSCDYMSTTVGPTLVKLLSMMKCLKVLKLPLMGFISSPTVLDTLNSLEWKTSFKNLKKLSLYGDRRKSFEENRLHQAFVVNFLKPCSNIETLTLRDVCVNNELILQLSQKRKLKELKLNTFSVNFLFRSQFEESLELGINTLKITKPFNTSFILLLLTYCPKVESLYLKNSRITKEMLKCIRRIRSLQRLHLKALLLDKDWNNAFSAFKYEKIIDLSGTNECDKEIEILLQEVRNLI